MIDTLIWCLCNPIFLTTIVFAILHIYQCLLEFILYGADQK